MLLNVCVLFFVSFSYKVAILPLYISAISLIVFAVSTGDMNNNVVFNGIGDIHPYVKKGVWVRSNAKWYQCEDENSMKHQIHVFVV
ncbi:hypothetical protein L1987_71878 [Smallanthus sonchifolius]|uniref:Uncharacterized protein n=1 Tax=Smallanthus sonchifolius TaxID=185202 RepID=A0ACB9AUB1_9ASTR|nr:hypothetical protein L1987_71878 [Smallanthus sonchifolius]